MDLSQDEIKTNCVFIRLWIKSWLMLLGKTSKMLQTSLTSPLVSICFFFNLFWFVGSIFWFTRSFSFLFWPSILFYHALHIWESFEFSENGTRHSREVSTSSICVEMENVGHPCHLFSFTNVAFLNALASLDFKLSVTEWVTFLQLAHLRVFQIIFLKHVVMSWYKCHVHNVL